MNKRPGRDSISIYNREVNGMNRLAIGFAAFWLGLGATQASAATTKIRYATIKGTASGPATGQCTEGYANLCPSGTCTCVQVPGATVGVVPLLPNIAGVGTANLFLTFDNGAATISGSNSCIPFFGVAELTTTRHAMASSETLNMNGVSCSPLTTNNPILGGFGISTTPAPVNGGKGYGKISGFLDPAGSVSLTLHGPITQ
jgi:hypothetical protein